MNNEQQYDTKPLNFGTMKATSEISVIVISVSKDENENTMCGHAFVGVCLTNGHGFIIRCEVCHHYLINVCGREEKNKR